MLYAVGLAIAHTVIRLSLKAETRDQSPVGPRYNFAVPSATDRCHLSGTPHSVALYTHVSPTLYNLSNQERR